MTGPLDPSDDPDRFRAEDEVPGSTGRPGRPGRGKTLPDLIGDGAHEDARDNLTWLLGLAGVIGFLVLVSLLVQLR